MGLVVAVFGFDVAGVLGFVGGFCWCVLLVGFVVCWFGVWVVVVGWCCLDLGLD